MKSTSLFLFIIISLLTVNQLFAQQQIIDFSKGKIVINGANNLNVEGYDGKKVLILDTYYEQNQPELEIGLTQINSRRPKINAEVEYKIKGKELILKTDLKTSRYVLKVPKNLAVTCNTLKGDNYYYDGLKTINISKIKGEIEVNCQGSVDVIVKDITSPVSVVSYGNITAMVEKMPTKGVLSFDTYLGYVNLSLPENAAANLNLTSNKGAIFSNLPVSKKDNSGKAKKLQATLGNGGVEVIINAEAGGDIYLRKAKPMAAVDYVHEPNSPHYIVFLANSKNEIMPKRDKLKAALFMYGIPNARTSSIQFGSSQLGIIRGFQNFSTATNIAKDGNKNNLEFLPISKNNYAKLVKNGSMDNYLKFYQSLSN